GPWPAGSAAGRGGSGAWHAAGGTRTALERRRYPPDLGIGRRLRLRLAAVSRPPPVADRRAVRTRPPGQARARGGAGRGVGTAGDTVGAGARRRGGVAADHRARAA